MTFRSKLIAAFAVTAALPLIVVAFGVRRQVHQRIGVDFDARRQAHAHAVWTDLAGESNAIGARLRALADALADDDRFRQAVVRGNASTRPYLLDYGTRAMMLSGLSMFQLQDATGRILSSGHFRQEFDRLDATTPGLLTQSTATPTLVRVRSPDGSFVALARVDSALVGDRRFLLVGGRRVDQAYLSSIAREPGALVRIEFAGGTVAGPDSVLAGDLVADTAMLAYAGETADGIGIEPARLIITSSLAPIASLKRGINLWFVLALAAVAAASFAVANWLAVRISRPIEELSHATTRIDLAGTDAGLTMNRPDEIGLLARRLASMATRLRRSAEQLREAERRATVGEIARQVNHDVKNGLVPIRNVLRHLGGLAERAPGEVGPAFAERRATLDASVEYLENLARTYARLAPSAERRAVDVNAVVTAAVRAAATSDDAVVRTNLAEPLPPVMGEAIVVRRIVDNLLRNALESFDGSPGTVTVRTSAVNGSVHLEVSDTGRGMSAETLVRAFDDFFTTKPGGTGLGLSVVRRLTSDLGGAVNVSSDPGRGTKFTITVPVARS